MIRFLALSAVLAGPALADAPRVAVDVPPVHSLVAQVMEGVGAPDLVVPPNASPHDFALRPSEAALLHDADLVIRVAPELSPGLARAVEALSDAPVLTLLDVAGSVVLDFRAGPVFADHGHDEHAEDPADEHGHDAAPEGEDDDGHADTDDHDHGHGGRDPHGWLDPENAVLWLPQIADALAELDPENAAAYAENAARAALSVAERQRAIAGRMAALQGREFVVFHDAYHYFEARFSVEAAGSIALGDGSVPGPRRLAEIAAAVQDQGIACAFAEPQFSANLVEVAFADAGARVVVIDPLGSQLEPGPGLYPALLDGIASAFEACLGAQ